ncbi:multiple myeloma tumor-associated protein 2 homolog [Manihot esculenta]|uniref:Multiple myeloma tumor-associated protein 2-like N-terminal domain-containing protein n=1 Tax=Manihot esculenta TaxID=3983 RepID=A0A2C9V5U5_MANES|nr:multiple myeloma tumor-associated protein 2 homolog [Manihot esculenta]OAY39041.1 hypothetical protein MANES_10G062700v8 [Manihot esculenta]
MYHPTRGGVRGGRDQFSWDDVKVDKHRENYLGHSIKAPVGRWQKGKDLHWYARGKNSESSGKDALQDEIKRIKEEEEQAMREALGLAPKRASRSQGNRLDKHEFSELVKRGSTAEDLGAGHAEAARVDGLGFSRAPRPWEDPSTLPYNHREASPEPVKEDVRDSLPSNSGEGEKEDESSRKKRRHEEKKHEKRERREKRRSYDSDDRKKHKKDKRRRHDSDSE